MKLKLSVTVRSPGSRWYFFFSEKNIGGKSGHYRTVCLVKTRDSRDKTTGQKVPQKIDRLT